MKVLISRSLLPTINKVIVDRKQERLERNVRIRLSTDGCELYDRSWNKEEHKSNEDELQCDVSDIMEFVPDKLTEEESEDGR